MDFEECLCGEDEFGECLPCERDDSDAKYDACVDDAICCQSIADAKRVIDRCGTWVKRYIPKQYLIEK